jgi:lysophospholipase L1-like esterase
MLFLAILCLLLGYSQVSRAQDWPDLNRYRKANAKLKPPSSGQKRVVFMGNSITDNWDHLDPSFFKDNPYIDRGISGQTTPQMLIRFRQDVIQLHPAVVVILGGINDIAGNTGPSTMKMIENNLTSMAQLAEFNHIKVVLCSLTPASHIGWNPKVHQVVNKILEMNKWIKNYARKNGYVYCDYYSALVDNRGGLKTKYALNAVHPNKAGYKLMEPIVVPAIHKASGQNE